MRTFYLLLTVASCSFLIQSCGEKQKAEEKTTTPLYTISYEIDKNGKDTINKMDNNGKQGLWLLRKPHEDLVIEKGIYKDDQKLGYWKRFNAKGELIDSVLYKDDLPY